MGTIFSSTDIRGVIGDTFTTEYIWNVGKAFAEWLPGDKAIAVIATEERVDTVVHALIEGVLLQGREVLDGGTGDKQQLQSLISERQLSGGVFIEHQAVQNLVVLTLLDASGADITDQSGLSSLTELASIGNFLPAATKGTVTSV